MIDVKGSAADCRSIILHLEGALYQFVIVKQGEVDTVAWEKQVRYKFMFLITYAISTHIKMFWYYVSMFYRILMHVRGEE